MISERLGVCDIRITGNNFAKLLSEILKSNIMLSELTQSTCEIRCRVLSVKINALKKLCEKHNCTLIIDSEQGINVKLRIHKKHFGLLIGIVIIIAFLSVISNHVLQVKIVGADAQTREAINAVLDDMDIGFGTFIPGISFYELETALTLETDCIAWAGVRSHGSTLIINVSQIKETPEMEQKRMPANIISTQNAVVTDVQVYSGKLNVMIGDAVAKGQILISGEYTDIDGEKRYKYTQADITGTFSHIANFKQDFVTIEKVISQTDYDSKSLLLFDADIPLFSETYEGKYIENESTSYFSFLGFELPIGIKHTSYDEYKYITITQTEDEARESIMADISRYENNFLSEYEIIDKNVTVKKDKNGFYAQVSYILSGEIGETQIILAKNQ